MRKKAIALSQKNKQLQTLRNNLYKTFYSTRLPNNGKMSNKQLKDIPVLINKLYQEEPLSPQEVAIIRRFQITQETWTEFLGEKPLMNYPESIQNLLYNDGIEDPNAVFNMFDDYLNSIPKLGDIE